MKNATFVNFLIAFLGGLTIWAKGNDQGTVWGICLFLTVIFVAVSVYSTGVWLSGFLILPKTKKATLVTVVVLCTDLGLSIWFARFFSWLG